MSNPDRLCNDCFNPAPCQCDEVFRWHSMDECGDDPDDFIDWFVQYGNHSVHGWVVQIGFDNEPQEAWRQALCESREDASQKAEEAIAWIRKMWNLDRPNINLTELEAELDRDFPGEGARFDDAVAKIVAAVGHAPPQPKEEPGDEP